MITETMWGFSLETRPETFFEHRLDREKCYELPESLLMKTLFKSPGAIFVDCGAHIGYHSCLAASLGAKVYAFEPNPFLLPLLIKNLSQFGSETYHVYTYALADFNGLGTLYLPSNHQDGRASFYTADPEAGQSLPEEVLVHQLDTVLSEPEIKLLKIDVEGAEALVLRGATNTLRNVRNVLVECADTSPVENIVEFLKDFQPYKPKEDYWEPVDQVVGIPVGDASQNYWFCRRK